MLVCRRGMSEVGQVGDRVVSNGPHADVVVKNNLCAVIPDNVDDDLLLLL